MLPSLSRGFAILFSFRLELDRCCSMSDEAKPPSTFSAAPTVPCMKVNALPNFVLGAHSGPDAPRRKLFLPRPSHFSGFFQVAVIFPRLRSECFPFILVCLAHALCTHPSRSLFSVASSRVLDVLWFPLLRRCRHGLFRYPSAGDLIPHSCVVFRSLTRGS